MGGIPIFHSFGQACRPAYQFFWINEAEAVLSEQPILSPAFSIHWDEGKVASCRVLMLFM